MTKNPLPGEIESLIAQLAETQKWNGILSDAYAHQQGLTHAACVSDRESWEQVRELKQEARYHEEKVAKVAELLKVQGEACNCKDDAYFRGMYNGLAVALSCLDESRPVFIDAPAVSERQKLTEQVEDLRNDRSALCDERDIMRRRLNTLQEANRIAGGELREAHIVSRSRLMEIKTLRQQLDARDGTISRLREMLSEAREDAPATSAQDTTENVASEQSGAKSAYPSSILRKPCPHYSTFTRCHSDGSAEEVCNGCLTVVRLMK